MEAVKFFPKQSNPLPCWKRCLDIGIVLLSVPLILPLSLLLAAAIQLVSPGAVLFKQERVGHRGRRFQCFKFRTMVAGANATTHREHLKQLMHSDAPLTKMDAEGDGRIIPLGKWMRAAGLDELPQLLNVLRGEMSLVGPRPCLPYEAENFTPAQRERFEAVPGLTGLWQVSGKNRTTFAQMVMLDIDYARSKSLWLDLKIMLLTPAALLFQMLDLWRQKRSLAVRPLPPVTQEPK